MICLIQNLDVIIIDNNDKGILYGTFLYLTEDSMHFTREMQRHKDRHKIHLTHIDTQTKTCQHTHGQRHITEVNTRPKKSYQRVQLQ